MNENEIEQDKIRKIAQKILGIAVLTPRGSDRLDFREVHVAEIEKALKAAYRDGMTVALTCVQEQLRKSK